MKTKKDKAKKGKLQSEPFLKDEETYTHAQSQNIQLHVHTDDLRNVGHEATKEFK